MVEHIVWVKWYGGKTKLGDVNTFGFGTVITVGADGNDDLTGADVYIKAEHLVPRPSGGDLLIGPLEQAERGLALRQAVYLATSDVSPGSLTDDVVWRVRDIPTLLSLIEQNRRGSVMLPDAIVKDLLDGSERYRERATHLDSRDTDVTAFDNPTQSELRRLAELASPDLRLRFERLARFVDWTDVELAANTEDYWDVPYSQADIWMGQTPRFGEEASYVRQLIFNWRMSHPSRPLSANPLSGLTIADFTSAIVERAAQLPMLTRLAHPDGLALLTYNETVGLVRRIVAGDDTSHPLLVIPRTMGAAADNLIDFLLQATSPNPLCDTPIASIVSPLDSNASGASSHSTDLANGQPWPVWEAIANCVSSMSESELNGWGHFLLHPKVVQRRQGDEYFYAKWRPVLQASMARTSDPILLGRAVDLGLAEQSPCLEFVLNREDHDWLTLVDKTRHLQLVYYTVKHGLHAAMHNLVRMPTEPAATVAQFTERVIYCDFVPSAQDVIDDVLSLVGSLEQVVDRALRQGENLSELFSHLAPACVRREVSQVRFCEAKLLKSHDDQNTENEPVWCGRVREKCLGRYTKSEMSPIMGQSCASNVAKVQLPVTYWSVAELFEALEIEHYPRGILGAADMGIRIGSWLNRVAEVAHRLRCSGCDQLMSQDFTYAKFDAVYRSTVLSCNNNSGGEHDRSVYLSRCWNCSAETRGGITFIDNRDCRVKFIHGSFPDAPEYLVCRTCGASADQPKLAATRYDAYALIGRICPNCGCKPSHWIGDRRQRTCPDCSHEIVLSAKHEEWIKRHRSGVAAFWVVNQEPDGWWEDRPPVADKGVFNRKSKEQN